MSDPEQLEHSEDHYIGHLRKVSQSHDISAHEDVYSKSGLKVIGKNVTINDELYDKLMQHKLLKPLDLSISVADRIDSEKLFADFEQQIKDDPNLSKIIDAFAHKQKLYDHLRAIELHDALAGKLTVLKLSLPGCYQHSLSTAILSVYIGLAAEKNDDVIHQLGVAGLLHDIGTLHIDPQIASKRERLTISDINQLSAHSVIAYMVLQAFPEYADVAKAVLEHHERLDGSGYPNQRLADDISMMGRILSVVEVFSSVLSRSQHLTDALIALKTHPEKYDRTIISKLISSLALVERESLSDVQQLKQTISKKLPLINQAIKSWTQPFLMVDDKDAIKSPASLITLRLRDLKQSLIRCGLTINNIDKYMTELGSDVDTLHETAALVNEEFYQLLEIAREILRRWPKLDNDIRLEKDNPLVNWILEIDDSIIKLPANLKHRR